MHFIKCITIKKKIGFIFSINIQLLNIIELVYNKQAID